MIQLPAPVYFLLVDDLEENLLALEGLLRREGLILLRARSGSAALELLLKYEVALALIDVQMPEMDGFELAELMRGTERTRRVPIIFLTAATDDRQRRFQGYEAGAVDFLHKPIEPDVLRSKADVFFDLFRQRQEVAQQRDELKAATQENARLLEESRSQAAALKEADRRKDEFIAMLAHELRNPLTPVQSAVEILRLTGDGNEGIGNALEIISRQVTHMARLIDDLLDVARIARGKVELRTSDCDLTGIIRQTAEDYRPSIEAGGVELEVQLPDEPLHLTGDPTRLAQVIGNLLHNASKFTPSGGKVCIAATVDPADAIAHLQVRDTGLGMDPEVVARLFEPFSQGDQALARTKGGLGLGLALARGLIQLHSGTITAESAGPGQGTSIHIRLPLCATPQSAEDNAEAAPAMEPGKLRILLVEDNPDTARTMQMLLSLLGHQVEVAMDGSTGVCMANELKPDVIISDLGLPGTTDGYALASAVRNNQGLSSVYLIALSGYGQEEDRRRTQQAGFDQHLVKPVGLPSLEEALQAVLNQRSLPVR